MKELVGGDAQQAGTIWTILLNRSVQVIEPDIIASIQQVGNETLGSLQTALSLNSPMELISRFKNGSRCYIAQVDRQVAAYGWVSFHEELVGELQLRLNLLPDEAYIWDCATLPNYRNHHLYSSLLGYMANDLKLYGINRVWIGADLRNVASQKGIDRAGYLKVADLVIERVLAVRQVWLRGYPGVPVSLVEAANRAFLGDRGKIWREAITI